MKRLMILLGLVLFGLPQQAHADEYQLLRFRATWCAPCVQQKQVFDGYHLDRYLQRVAVKDVYIDVDKNKDAVRKWRVTTVPCTILVLVDKDNRARTIRRLGGSEDNPHKHMDGATYQAFVTPRE